MRRKPGPCATSCSTNALRRLATEAATRFSALVAEGEQIPFDVAAESAEDSPFYSYVPLTGRYVAEHAEELRALPSFDAGPRGRWSRPASPPPTWRPAARSCRPNPAPAPSGC